MADITVVVVFSNEAPELLAQCLDRVTASGRRVAVVDNASADGGAAVAAASFPTVTVLRLEENVGYGAAANVGIEWADPDDVLLMNADAWPLADGIDRLAECAANHLRAGIVGPRIVDVRGRPQPSRLAFPTRWWTGRPALSSWPEHVRARRRGERSDKDPNRQTFLVGAVLLLRRGALEDVGVFDPRFFVFNEEVDLAWRMLRSKWSVQLCGKATFVHVGGSATRRNWSPMYLEQVRGHLRFLAKHRDVRTAEQARRYLLWVLSARRLLARGDAAYSYRDAVRWLRSGHAAELDGVVDRRPEPVDRTSDTAD